MEKKTNGTGLNVSGVEKQHGFLMDSHVQNVKEKERREKRLKSFLKKRKKQRNKETYRFFRFYTEEEWEKHRKEVLKKKMP